MTRLVQGHLGFARDLEARHQTKAGILDPVGELNALCFQFFDRLFDVLAHQYNSWNPDSEGSMGWMPSSAGGRAKISQLWPASTDLNSRTSRTNARTASASWLKMIAWAPVITDQPRRSPGYQAQPAGADTLGAVPVLLILLLFCALTLILLVPAIKGMKSRPLPLPSQNELPPQQFPSTPPPI